MRVEWFFVFLALISASERLVTSLISHNRPLVVNQLPADSLP